MSFLDFDCARLKPDMSFGTWNTSIIFLCMNFKTWDMFFIFDDKVPGFCTLHYWPAAKKQAISLPSLLNSFLPSSAQCFYIENIHLICIAKNQKKVVDKESMLIPGKIKETTFHWKILILSKFLTCFLKYDLFSGC